jgi:hypothetical protein
MVAVATPLLTVAMAKDSHTCSFDLTAASAVVKTNSGSPPASGSNTSAATLDGKLCGKLFHGAARDLNSFPTLGRFDGQIVNLGPLGSIKARFEGTASVNPDRSDSLRGQGWITGGTGAYHGAAGHVSFVGSKPRNSEVTTQHIIGEFHY